MYHTYISNAMHMTYALHCTEQQRFRGLQHTCKCIYIPSCMVHIPFSCFTHCMCISYFILHQLYTACKMYYTYSSYVTYTFSIYIYILHIHFLYIYTYHICMACTFHIEYILHIHFISDMHYRSSTQVAAVPQTQTYIGYRVCILL
jgi:hypothetical protein